MPRCPWAHRQPLIDYHDQEWGVPVHDDVELFGHLILDGAQAGLSWETVLKKREAYRLAFDNFDPEKVARYDAQRVARLMANPGIIRNRLKIASAIRNANAFLTLRQEVGSFDQFLWQFVDFSPQVNHFEVQTQLPARSDASDAMSKALKARGFNFVGTTICYAFMQAVGMINDHLVTCPRHKELSRAPKRRR